MRGRGNSVRGMIVGLVLISSIFSCVSLGLGKGNRIDVLGGNVPFVSSQQKGSDSDWEKARKIIEESVRKNKEGRLVRGGGNGTVELPPLPEFYERVPKVRQGVEVKVKAKLDEVPVSILRKLVKERQEKFRVLLGEENVRVEDGSVVKWVDENGGVVRFYFHPSLGVVFRFEGKEIEGVKGFTAKGSMDVFKEGEYLFLIPRGDIFSSKFMSLAVLLKDKNTEKESEVLLVGKMRENGSMKVVYNVRVRKMNVGGDEVLAMFLKKKGRCPVDGDMFEYEGRRWFFREKERGFPVMKKGNEVYACGKVFEIREVKIYGKVEGDYRERGVE